MSRIELGVGDRLAILGATGSGKTVLLREILKWYANATRGTVPIYILDTKVQGDFDMFLRRGIGHLIKGNQVPSPVRDTKGAPFNVWQPEEDNLEMYDEFFKGIYQLARSGKPRQFPGIVVTDELSSITMPSGKGTRHYEILQKQGRGMNVGMIGLTQSPSLIPNSFLRQATHMIRMHLNGEYDPKKMASYMGKSANEEPVDDYGFFYRNCSKPIAKSPVQYFPDFKDFFGME